MKKLSRILIVVICVAVLLSLASCAGGFLSKAKVKSLVKEYGTPQAEVTFDYTYNNTKTKIVFVYDLLLDKTPVAVINFIQLAESGYFDDVIIDHYVSMYQYLRFGEYVYRADEDDSNVMKYYRNNTVPSIVGEFAVNKYSEPKSGYAKFENLSLAMYHAEGTNYYNSAAGSVIMAMRTDALNYTNYAVFAHINSISVSLKDGDLKNYGKNIPSTYREQLTTTNTTSRTVYSADGTTSDKESLYSTNITVSVKILGDHDWSKLPKVTR